MIPVVDLERRMRRVESDVRSAVQRVVASGRLLLGAELEGFEREWAGYTGRRHAIGVACGTDALALALRSVGVGDRPDDEVIVPAFTAMPTLAAVRAAGAVPVPVDVNPSSGGLDPEAAAAAVTDRTRAVVPVHLYGRPCELPSLGVPVIDDAAHAHGALTAPSSAVATAYSFYPTKNLGGVGDGGAVVTDDQDVATQVRSRRRLYSRMSEIEAAVLSLLLPLLDADNDRRRFIAARYREAAPTLAWAADHRQHVHHLCVARERARLSGPLPFATAIHYPRASTQEPEYAGFTRTPCPASEEWARTCVTLPCFPEMTDIEVEIVAEALGKVDDA